MNLLLRFFLTVVMSRFRSPVGFTEVCTTSFRVWPTDLDVLMHMNNGKYFSIMDLARVDLMIRAGAFSILSKNGIYPVVASESMKFKKSLKLFQKFNIQTQVVGWDERNFYLRQKFVKGSDTVSLAYIKAQFLRKSGGRVSPQEINRLVGTSHVELNLPEYIKNWNESLEEGFGS